MQLARNQGRAGLCILAGLLVAAVGASAIVRPNPEVRGSTMTEPDSLVESNLRMCWNRPGEFFPVLGWREPVPLRDSNDEVERELAGVDPAAYNCHFYTRRIILARLGHATRPAPRHDLITIDFLQRSGLAHVEGPLHPGDVLIAGRPDERAGWVITHSAVVMEVDAAGAPTRIRQKFDGRHPVVDVSYQEFRTLYAGMHPWQIHAWRAL